MLLGLGLLTAGNADDQIQQVVRGLVDGLLSIRDDTGVEVDPAGLLLGQRGVGGDLQGGGRGRERRAAAGGEEDEVRAALEKACADEEIGLVLITDKLVAKCADTVFAYKLGRKRPLIVEMPDRHSDSNPGDSIRRYISEVVGVKI